MSIATLDPRLQSFWPARAKPGQNFPIAFCHVEGEEESSSIKTSHSNEQSKANEKEVRKVVSLKNVVYDYSYAVLIGDLAFQKVKLNEIDR